MKPSTDGWASSWLNPKRVVAYPGIHAPCHYTDVVMLWLVTTAYPFTCPKLISDDLFSSESWGKNKRRVAVSVLV